MSVKTSISVGQTSRNDVVFCKGTNIDGTEQSRGKGRPIKVVEMDRRLWVVYQS
jgi:hypothetical protein